MRQIIALDFETFYETGYGLKNMTYDEYILDKKFQVIGVGISDGQVSKWFKGKDADDFIRRSADKGLFERDDLWVVKHNAMFDDAVLLHHYGVRSTNSLCTMSIAASVLGETYRVNLGQLAEFLQRAGVQVPPKGEEVILAKGKRLEHFDPLELLEYGEYCKTDCVIAVAVFKFFSQYLSDTELLYQNQILRAYSDPTLGVNLPLLYKERERLKDVRERLFNQIKETYKLESDAEMFKLLRGRAAFPELLKGLYDIDVGMKPSKTATNPDGTAKLTPALAKGDEFMISLLEHDNPEVQVLASAKLAAGSTIAETRVERFIAWGEQFGYICAPYKISGAHTHRLSGTQKINMQNLPREGSDGYALRLAIQALRDDEVIVCGDYKNVEVRTGAYIAADMPKHAKLAAGYDPYLIQAAVMYQDDLDYLTEVHMSEGQHPDAKQVKVKRQAGKAAVLGCGYGTGWSKLMIFAKGIGINLTEEQAQMIVRLYRDNNPLTVDVWNSNKMMIRALLQRKDGFTLHGPNGDLLSTAMLKVGTERIPALRLPDGMFIKYPSLHQRKETNPERLKAGWKDVIEYRTNKGWATLHGAKLFENQNQAFAMCIAKQHIVEIAQELTVNTHGTPKTYGKFALNTHDEIAVVCKRADAEHVKEVMETVMSSTPAWAPGLAVGVSFDEISRNYS